MRLLMTADAVGGVWTYALDLAAGLCGQGVEITLAVLGPGLSPGQRTAVSRLPGVTAIDTGLPLEWTAASHDEVVAAAQGLADLARRTGADLIHLNSPALAGAAAFPAPIVGVCHSDLATWWSAVRGGEPPEDFRWRIDLTARGYRACDALIAPSAAFAQVTAQAYGVSPFVVRNGRASPDAALSEARDIPVITAGRLWDEGKGLATLDAAAARLHQPVLALGPVTGPQGQGERFAHLQLEGETTPGAVARAFGRAQVFTSAALYEPFGLAVLEAAQAGCALVLSDIPTFRELWDGVARFAPARDSEAFAIAIAALLADDGERASCAAAARARAQSYGLQPFVDGVASVHQAVLRGAQPREAAA